MIGLSLADPRLSTQLLADARGRRVELAHPSMHRAAAASTDPDWSAYLLESRRHVRRIGRKLRAGVSLFFILLGAATAPLFVLLALNQGGGLSLPQFAPPLMMVWLGVAVWFGNFGFRGSRVRDVLLSRGHCPGCLGLLPGEVAPDGCTVCPECGAAWRLDTPAPDNSPGKGA